MISLLCVVTKRFQMKFTLANRNTRHPSGEGEPLGNLILSLSLAPLPDYLDCDIETVCVCVCVLNLVFHCFALVTGIIFNLPQAEIQSAVFVPAISAILLLV